MGALGGLRELLVRGGSGGDSAVPQGQIRQDPGTSRDR